MDINKVLTNLSVRGFITHYAEDAASVLEYLKTAIPANATIGMGGCKSVAELGVLPKLKNAGYTISATGFSQLEYNEMTAFNRNVDYYFTSANALTEDGEIINIDGRGNRVANTIFGIPNIFFLIGVNKITKDLASGIERVRNVAAPPNCVRLNKNTPCVKTGKCEYCNSTDTICRTTVIHHHPTSSTKTYVILINRALGF